MIDATQVLNRLQEITTLDEDGAATCLPLCAEVTAEFSSKLRFKCDENNPLVIYAAATTVFYRYMLIRCLEDDGTTQFKAGDVTVTKSTQCLMETAEKLKQDALIASADLFCDNEFVFRQVSI